MQSYAISVNAPFSGKAFFFVHIVHIQVVLVYGAILLVSQRCCLRDPSRGDEACASLHADQKRLPRFVASLVLSS